MKRHRLTLALFAALQLADIATTHVALASGLSEGNPIPAAILAHSGEAGMYAVKLLTVLVFLSVVCWLQRRLRNPWRAVGWLNVVMAAVVVSNLIAVV